MEEFLRSIPAAAISPYALAAYGIAVVLFVVGYSRHRWMPALMGGLVIAIATVSTVAVLKPASVRQAALEEAEMQDRTDAWRETHPFGEISGTASVSLQLPQNERPQELDQWLGRVSKRYQELRRKGEKLPEYIEIRAYSHPIQNPDLEPQGEAEKFVDQLLFNSYYFVTASRDGSKPHLQGPSISVQARSEYVKVFFDGGTQKPSRIEGFAAGKGSFKPIAEHFTNWLDFYGANLTVRVRAVGASPQTLSLAKIENFSFTTKNDHWQATARFGPPSEVAPVVSHPGSLTIAAADWKTLGPVPDLPGKRLPSYGPRVSSRKAETPAVRP